jgi:hypothetical protein
VRANVSRAEDHALREFPFHVEVITAARMGIRVIGCREIVERLIEQACRWRGVRRRFGKAERRPNAILGVIFSGIQKEES